MIYTIRFMRDEIVLGETPWDSGLGEAKTHAREHMEINQADRVEVRDESGSLVFQHPRALRNA